MSTRTTTASRTLLRLLTEVLEQLCFTRMKEDCWVRATENDVNILAHLRMREDVDTIWLELGLGVRYERVQQALAELTEAAPSDEDSTFGCDLAHLLKGVNHSGWTFKAGTFRPEAACELINDFAQIALPRLEELRTIEDLHRLLLAATRNRAIPGFRRASVMLPVGLVT